MTDANEQHDQGFQADAREGAAHGSSADLTALAAERDEAVDKYRRALADYQNYQRRSIENEREARRQGVTDVLNSIIPVLDHFDLALSHKSDGAATSQVIEGVKVIRDELVKALSRHGIGIISPAPGDELDPLRHQVIVQQPAAGVQPGRISMTLQVGYTLEHRIVRPAKVAVAPTQSE
jgi:molecular chaperone GrpE